ncbi:MAG: rod shape-determining protein MreD [Dehalococcoidia bacterium]
MRYGIAFLLASFLAVFSVSAMPYVKVLGVTPDFVLIFAVCWAVIRGQDEAWIVVPVAGFLSDLATSDPLGTSALAMIPVVVLAAAVRLRALDSDFLPTIAVVAASSLAYGIISMIVLGATGQHIETGQALFRVVLAAMVVNALFTPILYLPIRWLSPPTGPAVLGSHRISSTL